MSSKLLKTKYAVENKSDCFFTQHQIQITSCGKYIFCQCSDCITIVQLDSGNVIKKIEFEEDEVSSLSLSPNDQFLAVGFNSSTVKHYELKYTPEIDTQLLTSFKSYHRGPVLTMCWDSLSVFLASGSSEGSARVWDLKQKYCTHSLKEAKGIIRVLKFYNSLNQRPWIFGAADIVIFIWLLQAGSSKVLAKMEGHDSPVTGFQISYSSDLLISSGLDKVIIVWDLTTFSSKKIIPVFDSLSGIILKPEEISFAGITQEVEGNVVFTIGNQGTPRIWNTDKGKELWKSMEPVVPPVKEEVLLIYQVFLVEAHKSIALTTHDNNIFLIYCDSMTVWKQLVGHNDEILDAIFLGEEEKYTVVASNSNQIRIYDNSNNNCILVSGHSSTVLALANHPVDKSIFASSSHDNTAKIWKQSENGSCTCLATASGHTHSIGAISFAADFLITGSKDTCLKKWSFSMRSLLAGKETLSSTKTQIAHGKDVNHVALSKNFQFVASASQDRTAKIWDSKSLELLGTLQGHKKGIWCVQFSPTDRIVATASADGTIRLWTISSFTNVATFEGHEVGVLRLAWVSQGQQLVSAGSDGLIKLWTMKNNICAGTFDEHEGRVWALSVAQDGMKMVTGGVDSSLIRWRDVTEEETKKEQEEANRLVEEEQMLLNLLQKKRWSKALRLSLRLNQPFRGLNIMKSLLDESPEELHIVLRRLRKDEMTTLIEFAVQWNTKTKNVREAQTVLNYLLKSYPPEDLEKLANWKTILEGFLPYTARHTKRVAALQQSSAIIHYMVSSVSLADDLKPAIEECEDEITALLNIIPKEKEEIEEKDEEMEATSEEESGVSGDEEIEMNDDIPIESVEDIRCNYAYEEIEAETEESGDESGISER